MIKQENIDHSQNQTWTYTDKGRKFTVQKRDHLFTLKVHNQLTMEWFQCSSVELNKINEKTIEAAFDSSQRAVKYQFQQKSEDDVILEFIVKLEYLSTQFREAILLKKVEMSKYNAMKLQYEELSQEIRSVQKMVQTLKVSSQQQMISQKINLDSYNGVAYQFDLKKGKYLLSLSGYYSSYVAYMGEYEDDYDQMGNVIQSQYGKQHNIPLKTTISFRNSVLEFISPQPNFLASYCYHFSLSTILDLKKEENININFLLNDGSRAMVSQSMLTIFPCSDPY